MHLVSGYEQRRARIEIVPLIDVVFLLLVFFIYAMLSMTVYRGLRVSLPQAGGEMESGAPLIITIDANNALWVNQMRMTRAEVVAVAKAQAAAPDQPVLISGDCQADLGVSIALLGALRAAGVEQVSFQVRVNE